MPSTHLSVRSTAVAQGEARRRLGKPLVGVLRCYGEIVVHQESCQKDLGVVQGVAAEEVAGYSILRTAPNERTAEVSR
jgi:hypothetical protein